MTLDPYLESEWTFSPGLIYGLPVGDRIELNLTAKYLIPLEEDCSNLVFVNLGVAVVNLGNWILRPETGVLFNPGESGQFWRLGLGVSRRLGG